MVGLRGPILSFEVMLLERTPQFVIRLMDTQISRKFICQLYQVYILGPGRLTNFAWFCLIEGTANNTNFYMGGKPIGGGEVQQ